MLSSDIVLKWKSDFSNLICVSSGSLSPEHFAKRIVQTLYKRIGSCRYLLISMKSLAFLM